MNDSTIDKIPNEATGFEALSRPPQGNSLVEAFSEPLVVHNNSHDVHRNNPMCEARILQIGHVWLRIIILTLYLNSSLITKYNNKMVDTSIKFEGGTKQYTSNNSTTSTLSTLT